ncbi:GNAT family N-acetyltransferase [Geodermatophilus marinus]|uniref:GNAT family N-acetyltransferase n=1 Tax=Geodermatophilus sp. LHW52908 TaxID=2303986 RepID=UPI001313F415|nr:GNAT family N-acetyltransferase [Geodermatophilus sp. LHW52908]
MVRAATPADAAAVAGVHARAGRAAWSSFLGDVLAEPDVATWAARVTEPGFVVAERTGRVVAFARADEQAGEVALLYVDPDEQGRGTGRLLLGLVLDRLRAAGHAVARLRTEERNTGPRRFYEAEGFVSTGEVLERTWHGRSLREVWYARPLL